MDAWHRRPSLCCAAVPNKPRRLLDWSAPCACRRTAALRHNERQQAFPGRAFETDTREPPRREGSWAGRRPSVSRPERCRHPARSCGHADGGTHAHLHCVLPAGGISPDGTRWISCRPNYVLPVPVLRLLFRRLFLNYLEQAFDAGGLQLFASLEPLRTRHAFLRHIAPTRKINWKVYAKPPFGGPEQVLKYVARYTHRVAISNDRLLGL